MGLSQAPTRPATKKQRKPEPARVVQSYWHEVQTRGKRGALRRTGDLYNISDESVRRYVAADEQRAEVAPALPAELAYTPAPGEASYQAERDRRAAELAAQQHKALTPAPAPAPAMRHKPRPHCHRRSHGLQVRVRDTVMSSRATFERGTVANVPTLPQSTHATRHSAEPARTATDEPTTPQTIRPAAPGAPAGSVKRYMARPAPRPAYARVVERIRAHVNPYMALALLAVLVLVLAVQYSQYVR